MIEAIAVTIVIFMIIAYLWKWAGTERDPIDTRGAMHWHEKRLRDLRTLTGGEIIECHDNHRVREGKFRQWRNGRLQVEVSPGVMKYFLEDYFVRTIKLS